MLLTNPTPSLFPVLTPHGALVLEAGRDDFALSAEVISRLENAFMQGSGYGLLHLGLSESNTLLPPTFAWWRGFAVRFISALCHNVDIASNNSKSLIVPPPEQVVISQLLDDAPNMKGGEYLYADTIILLWQLINHALNASLRVEKLGLEEFLRARNSAWHLVGRVHFNLAENRKDEENPFAFLATYTTGISSAGTAKHTPLGQALKEYAGNNAQLLKLLMPVHAAAEKCTWLKEIVEENEIYHPMRWQVQDALKLMQDAEILESSGIVVRFPASWKMNRPSRPMVKATVGSKSPSVVGLNGLLDFNVEISLDGEALTQKEIKEILAGSNGLAMVRGKWIEVDKEKLEKTLAKFKEIEEKAKKEGVSFAEAMRLLSSADIGNGTNDETYKNWASVSAGDWLAQTLKNLRSPENLPTSKQPKNLKATLRPYQKSGVEWLYMLTKLRLGACLADDMGLGKTIQLLTLLLTIKNNKESKSPSLLVAPASLLGNWQAEARKFTPDLQVLIAHPSALPPKISKSELIQKITGKDLVITSYGGLLRMEVLAETSWNLVVLDEAQAIKNPDTKQTKMVKKLNANSRIALTGTPIENRLSDLWSIFDFINQGLLGNGKEFTNFTKKIESQEKPSYAPLRNLVRPYILRRLKTDKNIISDLPDKTEIRTNCNLSRKQAAIYQDAVGELQKALKEMKNDEHSIARKGLVLSYMMRFKQICNHPSQWLGDNAWEETDSGKFARLREIAETIAQRQEKMLIFTQFKEITEQLSAFLATIFGRQGLVLHGGTDIKKRKEMVDKFQNDERVPFFVLSIKAGGTGLNLTAASHVVHFDRWWNPAVEDQATDRAFRIGQKKNVLVHKFVCQGTIEDKINEMLETKKKQAGDILEHDVKAGDEINITAMKDDDLLKLVTLDINSAMMEVT